MRVTNRIVAALLAAAIAAAGVVAIVEMVNAAFGSGYAIVDWRAAAGAMARNSWSDTGPAVLGVMLGVVGVLLLVLGLRRGRLEWFTVQPSLAGTSTFAAGRGVGRALASAAEDVDGVSRAKVRLRRRTARVKIEFHPRVNPDAPEQVRDEIYERLVSFDLVSPPKVKLKVKASRPASPDSGVVPQPASPAPSSPAPSSPAPSSPAPSSGDAARALARTGPGSSSAPPASQSTPATQSAPATQSTTETIFGTSTAGERTRPYPVGLDLTKPDPERTRKDTPATAPADASADDRKEDHT
ncbi:DUF6286 domain-containing protein [Frankia sp. Cas3]|uniref:DUF6286 domain-containing protein n=1 Tax=Frankia sp. Cas3 TaxID=3073926 RepID=UPI002AD33639|nr:DUF6286 domain-containing protein [Frankia sp. Cas3]